MATPCNGLARQIALILRRRGMTASQFSAEVGKSKSWFSVMAGQDCWLPPPALLCEMARVLGVPAEELATKTDDVREDVAPPPVASSLHDADPPSGPGEGTIPAPASPADVPDFFEWLGCQTAVPDRGPYATDRDLGFPRGTVSRTTNTRRPMQPDRIALLGAHFGAPAEWISVWQATVIPPSYVTGKVDKRHGRGAAPRVKRPICRGCGRECPHVGAKAIERIKTLDGSGETYLCTSCRGEDRWETVSCRRCGRTADRTVSYLEALDTLERGPSGATYLCKRCAAHETSAPLARRFSRHTAFRPLIRPRCAARRFVSIWQRASSSSKKRIRLRSSSFATRAHGRGGARKGAAAHGHGR